MAGKDLCIYRPGSITEKVSGFYYVMLILIKQEECKPEKNMDKVSNTHGLNEKHTMWSVIDQVYRLFV